ncbi:MAG: hypothetical protein WCI47_02380 [bacterium]
MPNTPQKLSAAKQSSIKTTRFWWRAFASYLLIVLAAVVFIASTIVEYQVNYISNTDNFVTLVRPLVKDEVVAQAIAVYSTEKLIDTDRATERIRASLPPILDPLAPALVTALQTETTKITKNIVQSDQFLAVFETSMRISHSRFMKLARAVPKRSSEDRIDAAVDLGELVKSVRGRLGANQSLLQDNTIDNLVATQERLAGYSDEIRLLVKTTDATNNTLPYVYWALILGSIALANNRRRACLTNGLLTLLAGSVMLIALNIGTTTSISSMTPLNAQAASHIISQMIAPLRQAINTSLVVAGLVAFIAFITGPLGWTKPVRKKLKKSAVYTSLPLDKILKVRKYVFDYQQYAYGIGLIGLIGSGLATPDLVISKAIIGTSLYLSLVSITYIVAGKSPAGQKSTGQ